MTTAVHCPTVVRHSAESVLRLRFAAPNASSRAMDIQRQDPPWKVVRSFQTPGGENLAHLHNLSGGVLGGDQLRLEVDLEPGAQVQLTSTGATRIYRHREPRSAASNISRLRVGAGALLEFLPDQIIPYAGSVFEQDTEVQLSSDHAGLFWWETVTPGRTASGEAFQYRRLSLRSAVMTEERPLALDRFCLEPHRASPQRIGALGRFACSSTFYICRTGAAPSVWIELERILMAESELLSGERGIWGASRLVQDGLMVRGLGHESAEMSRGLFRFWSLAKQFLYAREAVLPRKVY